MLHTFTCANMLHFAGFYHKYMFKEIWIDGTPERDIITVSTFQEMTRPRFWPHSHYDGLMARFDAILWRHDGRFVLSLARRIILTTVSRWKLSRRWCFIDRFHYAITTLIWRRCGKYGFTRLVTTCARHQRGAGLRYDGHTSNEDMPQTHADCLSIYCRHVIYASLILRFKMFIHDTWLMTSMSACTMMRDFAMPTLSVR